MKIFYQILLLTVIISIKLTAQDIENEILNYSDTDIQIINKSRKLILDKLYEKDLEKVKEALNYLDEKFDTSKVITFWETERWLIEFLTLNFDYILSSSKHFKPSPYSSYQYKLLPPQDLLQTELLELGSLRYNNIRDAISLNNYNKEEKDLLNLTLNYLLISDKEDGINQENVNSQANLFLNNYKYSPYSHFVKNYIRFAYKLSDWAFGYGFSIGYGSFNGGIKDYIRSYMPLGFEIDLYYKTIVSSLRFSAGVLSKVKQEFEYKGLWKKDLKLNIYHAELSIGYPMTYVSNFRINPYFGLSIGNISPPSAVAEEEGNDVDLGTEVGMVLGLNATINLSSSSQFLGEKTFISDWVLNIRIGYSTVSYESRNSSLDGNTFFINFGVGGLTSSLIRDL
jgi:hypothetical protein